VRIPTFGWLTLVATSNIKYNSQACCFKQLADKHGTCDNSNHLRRHQKVCSQRLPATAGQLLRPFLVLPCPASASITACAPKTRGPCTPPPWGACWGCCRAARAPGARDTPKRATQEGRVSGRCRATACLRHAASSTRPAGARRGIALY